MTKQTDLISRLAKPPDDSATPAPTLSNEVEL